MALARTVGLVLYLILSSLRVLRPALLLPGRFPPRMCSWSTWAVLGIVLATFFSDVGHEMVTAVLPLYLATIGLGLAALGVMEGLADLVFSVSKLGGGLVGHRSDKKRPWATLGYLTTTLGTGAIALTHSVSALVTLRAVAWFGRGFRSPLRDFLLADEVGPTHFGRAYGMERSADMLGAVAGPLMAKAVAAEFLPRELRSLGFGILACANAVGDMGSSLYVGFLLAAGQDTLAFVAPAIVSLLGVMWMLVLLQRGRGQTQVVQVD